jgi:Cysteine-rich CWC
MAGAVHDRQVGIFGKCRIDGRALALVKRGPVHGLHASSVETVCAQSHANLVTLRTVDSRHPFTIAYSEDRRWASGVVYSVFPARCATNATIMNEIETPIIREKHCAVCGAEFECHAGGCWCDAVPLTEQRRAQLLERYVDCLCPTCLRQQASLEVR